MIAKGNNVYILGAGFSAYAGMPLISNFLEKLRDLREFSDYPSKSAIAAIDKILKERALLSSVREKVKIDLDNIEELFSLIDAGGTVTSNNNLDAKQKAIRKAIAATLIYSENFDGTIFCEVVPAIQENLVKIIPNLKTHRTGPFPGIEVNPYVLFAGIIGHKLDSINSNSSVEDIVITFNYDLILEKALRTFGINPDYCIRNAKYAASMKPTANTIKLIKLHGSINWALSDTGKTNIQIVNKPMELIEDEDKYPVLLPPTWNKGSFINTLSSLWTQAIEAIKKATRVIVIGYSMPTTDLYFKYFISAGLRQNHSLRSFVIINPTDISSQYRSFFDETYFAKRLIIPKSDYPDEEGVRFGTLMGRAEDINKFLGRGFYLTDKNFVDI